MKKLSIIIGVLIALFANVENAFGTYYYGGAGDGFDAGESAGSAGAPSVTTITPSSGSNASMVTIYLTGTNFFAGTASSAVTLVRFDDGGSTALGFGGASISDTSINGVLVPSGIQPGTYNVRVSTTAGTNTTSGDKFVVTAPSQVSIPSIIPAAGTYTDLVTIVMSTATSGATIRYTTDGVVPTVASAIYTVPFTQTTSATVMAIGMKGGMTDSATATSVFTVKALAPVITPATGTYSGSVTITMATGTSGATIRYTTDGTMPNGASQIYWWTPFIQTTSATIVAFAMKNGMADSSTSTATFTVQALLPTVTNIFPSTGINTLSVQITVIGTNFYAGTASSCVTSMKLDDSLNTALNISGIYGSDTMIGGVIIPAGIQPGTYNLKVTTTSGTNTTSGNKFVVMDSVPVVNTVAPDTCANNTTTSVTISGTGFYGGTGTPNVSSLQFVRTSAPVVTMLIASYNVASDTLNNYASVPTGYSPGTYDIRVTTNGGTNTTSAQKFVLTAPLPAVSSIFPSSAGNGSSTVVTILGSYFFAGTASSCVISVKFDDAGSTSLTFSGAQSDTIIGGVTVPAGIQQGTYNVLVTTTDGTNTSSAQKFTVTDDPPVSVVVLPANGSTLSTLAIISGIATDSAGISNVKISIKNTTDTLFWNGSWGGVPTWLGAAGTSNWSFDSSSVTWSNGKYYYIQSKAKDNNGNDETPGAGNTFLCQIMTVSSITPTTQANTSSVALSIWGSSFVSGATAKLSKAGQNDITGTSVTVYNPNFMFGSFNIIDKAPGVWDVTVTNPDTQFSTLTCLTITASAPTVTGVAPSTASNIGSKTVTITGTNIFSGATTLLTLSGQSNISGTGVSVLSNTQLRAVFDVDGKVTGAWSVRVANTDGQSNTGSSMFTLIVNVATPSITPAAGTYTGAVTITMATGTSGATIHYTTDGSAPTAGSTVYTAPITRTSNSTIVAFAIKGGWSNSAAATSVFTIQTTTPVITPAAGMFTDAVNITMATSTSGATIRYTTNGIGLTDYVGSFTKTATSTIVAYTTKGGMLDSSTSTSIFTIKAATPVITPVADTYTNSVTIAMSTSTTGATIKYTLDNSAPTLSSTDYTTPITQSTTVTVRAAAFKAGLVDSDIAATAYTIQAATPVITTAAGVYADSVSITITTSTSGASIRYTTNGSGLTDYSGPVTKTSTSTIVAYAAKGGLIDSSTSTKIFTVTGTAVKLQLLVPGEAVAPGSPTGKTGSPSARTAGSIFTVTVNAVDANWYTISSSNPTVTISTSDLYDVEPSAKVLSSGTNTFNVMFRTAGSSTTITASCTGLTLNQSPAITVNPNTAVKLQLLLPGEGAVAGMTTGTPGKTGSPSARTAGTAFNVTVNCVDSWWNIVTSAAQPEVIITTTDIYDTEPAASSLISSVKTFSVTLKTAGNTVISASDTQGLGTNYTQDVSPSTTINTGAAAKLQLLLPGEATIPGSASGKTGTLTAQVAGTAFNATVNCVDANWNKVTSANPQAKVLTSDVSDSEPAAAFLTLGTKSYSVTLVTAGIVVITATDLGLTYTDSVSPNLTVNLASGTPMILSSKAGSDNILVTYDMAMDLTSVTNKANYAVQSPVGTPISLASATLGYSSGTYTVTIASVSLTSTYNVTIAGVKNAALGTIVSNGTDNVTSGSVDITEPTGTVNINGGAVYTNNTTVTLALSSADSSGVAEMKFSNDDSTWSSPESYGTAKAWTLNSGDGAKTVYAKFKDTVGNWTSGSITDVITLDTTAPTGSISINSGAATTAMTIVTLTLSAADTTSTVVSMQFSNDGSAYSSLEAYNTNKSWAMTGGDGTKTVYVKYKDGAGNISGSITDSILLYTIPEVTGITPSTGANNSSPVTVTITGSNFFGGTGTSAVTTINLDDPASTAFINILSANITDTQINTAVIPGGVKAGSYNVKVTTPMGTNVSSSQKFVVTTAAPDVSNGYRWGGSSLNTSPVTISVTGSGFFAGTSTSDVQNVILDTTPTPTSALTNSITVSSDIKIFQSIFPAGITPGTYNVIVTTGGGSNTTSSTKLTLTSPLVPVVSNITPSIGSNLSALDVNINGLEFFGGMATSAVTSVNLDDPANTAFVNVYPGYITDTQISLAVIPAGIKAGSYNVRVTTTNGVNTTSAQKFVVTTPIPVVNTVSILGSEPATNTAIFTLAITGSGFFGGTAGSDVLSVKLSTSPTYTSAISNSISVGSDAVISSVSVPLVVPAGTYNLIVTNSSGTNVTSTQKVTVIEIAGFEPGEVLVDNTAVNNINVTATDGSGTKIIIPPGCLNKDVKLLITKDDSVTDGIAYNFRMKDNATNALITNLLKPATLTLYYSINGGVVLNTGVPESSANTKLAVYYFDGVSWRKLVSVVNPFDKTVTAQTQKTGLYAIKSVVSYGDKVLANPNPFTPNGDGVNDSVSFYFDNDNSDPVTIKIYNRRSDLIRALTNSNSWDGKTDTGSNAVPGLYYWQVEINGAVKKRGSITLAR